MSSDSNKNLFLAFAIIVPLLLAILCVGVISGQSDPIEALKEARRPRTLLDELSDMRVSYAEGKWEESLKASRVVLQRQPGHEEALHTVAASCFKLKRAGEAAAALKVLVDDVPEDIPTSIQLAQALTMIGEKAEAERQWERIKASRYSTKDQRQLARKALIALYPESVISTPPRLEVGEEGKPLTSSVQ
jgi:tetratricopeptide (TPR) repeat protein